MWRKYSALRYIRKIFLISFLFTVHSESEKEEFSNNIILSLIEKFNIKYRMAGLNLSLN